MADPKPVLILTRPEPEARAFLADCEARIGTDIVSVVSPIIDIVPVSARVDLDRYETVIVTSGNAVLHAPGPLSDRTVATVGQRTAELAAASGAEATCLGLTVDGFIENAKLLRGPAIHIRGRHTRGALAQRASEKGVEVDEVVVYDQVDKPLSDGAREALLSGRAIVPVFSPRSAALVSANPAAPSTRVLAISPAAAAAWASDGQVQIARHPDRDAMLNLVAACF